jgi:RimJ/RimL family protein N-acetyltransferase
MQILLETSRIRLRCFMAGDGEHLYALDNDPEVMRYINGGAHTPRELFADQILPSFMQYTPGSIFGVWAAEEKESGAFIGWLSLRPSADNPGEAILGYRLCRAAWGRGLATEGARALVNKGFAEMGLQRIVATTYAENLPSRRVMEKLGMKLVRRFRLTVEDLAQVDTFHVDTLDLWDGDDVEYALRRSQWQQEDDFPSQ